MLSDKFTHVNAANQPTMVDVGPKTPTRRLARAHCRVVLGPELLGRVQAGELPSHKGPVIHTAILAGIMGAKKRLISSHSATRWVWMIVKLPSSPMAPTPCA